MNDYYYSTNHSNCKSEYFVVFWSLVLFVSIVSHPILQSTINSSYSSTILTVFQTSINIQLIGIILCCFDHMLIEKSSQLFMLTFIRIERFRIEIRISMCSKDYQQCRLKPIHSYMMQSMSTFLTLRRRVSFPRIKSLIFHSVIGEVHCSNRRSEDNEEEKIM